ncbi:hypothetical protein [Anaerotignum sp. MB30-C6]|uniref:hypothetical protein n=1 Tax=Anaerotignum sp. MB30-C6 TaxID=3070814 RepID=UPI0027DD39F3|nr:hypothetical protein [Anaerotignum sp. MB30-C6]WMI81802.1 hypothetical protein RBQ60_03485 [Anaerotignum sp. MB30-C6]WMI81901.1 hypothetical protein RBQ60_04000 [Anaerotignum sp. MB30-C6]
MSFYSDVAKVLSVYNFEKVGDLTKSEFEKLMAEILSASVDTYSQEMQFKLKQRNLAVGRR